MNVVHDKYQFVDLSFVKDPPDRLAVIRLRMIDKIRLLWYNMKCAIIKLLRRD